MVHRYGDPPVSDDNEPAFAGNGIAGNGMVDQAEADALVRTIIGALHRKVASDLSDVAEQRLLKVGLMLNTALHSFDRAEQRRQVLNALAELDGAINAVRVAMFDIIEGPGQDPSTQYGQR